ncbi:serine/threonine-protein phosphatase 4 regulatory subunit 1-like isoform X2 [Acanthaster planci]|uniref:Serine/threonine-protein phosphatase 4 regulatory subunit 1-like isoform X2 n=1 Tax=Acanthaster planci TaxID=133434 RepID=A0A8B7ZLW7_ACAPL|nr:serine/threonine-protein phosphatase 4 regulatory subunit 1-like isoform X2 [Acanthaster planci]
MDYIEAFNQKLMVLAHVTVVGDEKSDDFQLLSSPLDTPTQDELLTPLARLQKYANTDNGFNRQTATRILLEALRTLCDQEERDMALDTMLRLSEDQEPMVRAELMEQIPHIAMLCQENRGFFPNTVQDYILPLVVRYLTDTNNQVRKTSQAALLVLLEQDLIEKKDIEEQVCPIILQLSGQGSSEDYRNEAVALMSKVAPLAGKDITLNQFLPQFTELCSDSMFHIRKVCAANFGDICNVVGEEATEDLLLPKFEDLCEDGVWGVRKACAECFMAVSWAVSKTVRAGKLSPLFVKLLTDQSRWVRMAAFQTLGPFISTFADPLVSGVQVVYNPDGTVQIASVVDNNESESDEVPSLVFSELQSSQQSSSSGPGQSSGQDPRTHCAMQAVAMEVDETVGGSSVMMGLGQDKGDVVPLKTEPVEVAQASSNVHQGLGHVEFTPEQGMLSVTPEMSNSYDSFLFWRNPIPVIDVLPESGDTKEDDPSSERFTTVAELTLETTASSSGDEQKSSPDSGIASPTGTPDLGAGCDSESEQTKEADRLDESQKDPTEIGESLSDITLQDTASQPAKEVDGNANVSAGGQSGASQPLGETGGMVVHKANLNEAEEVLETVSNICSTHVIGQRLNEKTLTFRNGVVEEEVAPEWSDSEPSVNTSTEHHTPERSHRLAQDVIPAELLDLYLSMTDPSRAQTVDTEIARHCAFSLPGVALTMGRKNWKCLKEVYETLASDMQWKVRRTLAFSIHEMALILGDEVTAVDLVPIFNSFLRDLDEVRIGVLKHFADFVKLLKPELRRQYLSRMTDFLTTDNTRNWRFRLELAEQLILLCDMYDPSDVCEHLFPIALALAGDRVADVRFTAYRLLGVIMKRINTAEDRTLMQNFIDGIISKYANSDRWFGRQTFIHLCQKLLEVQSVENEQFAENLLPSLLSLVNDSIPNVRITLARLLTQNLLPVDFYQSMANPCYEKMMDVVGQLQKDVDQDVRYFSSYNFNNVHNKNIDHPV